MADAPWVRWFTDDFLQGCALSNLTAEDRGVYTTILALMASRGGPIDNDKRWIAQQSGCRSTRQAGIIIERLIESGKIEDRDGLLGNGRMILEVEERAKKSDGARKAAMTRWHSEQETLDLDDPENQVPKNKSNLSGGKNGDKKKKNDGKKTTKPQKPANPDHADAHATRAQNSQLTTQSRSNERQIDDEDFFKKWQEVCAVSGFAPSNTSKIASSQDIVRGWCELGVSFDDIVIPTIRSTIANSGDPTGSLMRFDAQVRHEAARVAARPKKMGQPPKPRAPIALTDDVGENISKFRRGLALHCGEFFYNRHLGPDRMAVRLVDGSILECWLDAHDLSIVQKSENLTHLNGLAGAQGYKFTFKEIRDAG